MFELWLRGMFLFYAQKNCVSEVYVLDFFVIRWLKLEPKSNKADLVFG